LRCQYRVQAIGTMELVAHKNHLVVFAGETI
jgi:hypothetical protein